jgi:Uncharacterized protein conserved in bacteria (DUF2188)
VARSQYWVSPYGEHSWKVTNKGVELSRHGTKPPAIDAGVTAAKADQPSELIIQHRDGTIEDKRTYGDDPFPPRG